MLDNKVLDQIYDAFNKINDIADDHDKALSEYQAMDLAIKSLALQEKRSQNIILMDIRTRIGMLSNH